MNSRDGKSSEAELYSRQKAKCHDNNCNSCICDTLSKLQAQTEVDVFLSSGHTLEDVVFITLNPKNCCAFFNDPTTEPGSTLIVDCKQIAAIRIEAD